VQSPVESALDAPAGYKSKPGGSQLESVSCLSADHCVAVGQYFTSASSAYPLAERWNGASWVIQATPATPPSIGLDPFATPSGFHSVQCTSMQSCMAVGAGGTSQGRGDAIAAHWNGTRWTSIATARESLPLSELNSLSCSAADSCIAVGDEGSMDQRLLYQPRLLVESWNGRAWVNLPTP
jgi:hypothetical protein